MWRQLVRGVFTLWLKLWRLLFLVAKNQIFGLIQNLYWRSTRT